MKNPKKSKQDDKKITKVVQSAIVKTSKMQKVKEHLVAKRTITSWQAIDKYGVTRLAAIIFNLRTAGWIIDTKDIAFEDRYGNKGSYAKYTLLSEPKKSKAKK